MHSRAYLKLLLIYLHSAYCTATLCGSSMSLNQYIDAFNSAPPCFYDGCKPSNSTTIAPDCDINAPCSSIWKSLFESQPNNQDWCRTCPGDRVCRIPQSPVFGLSVTCIGSQFSSPQMACCASKTQLQELANWTNSLCGGSWKSRYQAYDQMAPVDWNRYKFPLDYNVRPQNESGIELPTPRCPSPNKYFGVLTAEAAVEIVTGIGGTIFALWKIRSQRSDKRDFQGKLLILALGAAALRLALVFASAYHIHRTPGYKHVPWIKLALLFCCRPRVSWIMMLGEPFSGHLNRLLAYESEQQKTAGKDLIRKKLANAAGGEVCLQVISLYTVGSVVDTGFKKNFYVSKNLAPFSGGGEAQRIYVTALVWLVFTAITVIVWSCTTFFYFLLYREFWKLRRKVLALLSKPDPRSSEVGSESHENTVKLLEPNKAHDFIASPGSFTEHHAHGVRRLEPELDDDFEEGGYSGHKLYGTGFLLKSGARLVTLLALLCYSLSWVFWYGLIRSWGESWCPPSLSVVGILWIIGDVLGIGVSLGA